MATSTDYHIHVCAQPLFSPVGAPVFVEIQLTHQRKKQHRTPTGNVVTDQIFVFSELPDVISVPHQVLASPSPCDSYVLNRLSNLGYDPTLCDHLKQCIIPFTFDVAPFFGTNNGFLIIAEVEVVTVELVTLDMSDDVDALWDQIFSILLENGIGTDDSVQRGASKSAIDGLKKEMFDGGEDGQCTCAVCLEDFGEGAEITSMPCAHVFHHGCIVPWLERNNTCPMCRCAVPD